MPRSPALTIADHLVLARAESLQMFQMRCKLTETVAKTSDMISESREMMAAADDLMARWSRPATLPIL